MVKYGLPVEYNYDSRMRKNEEKKTISIGIILPTEQKLPKTQAYFLARDKSRQN